MKRIISYGCILVCVLVAVVLPDFLARTDSIPDPCVRVTYMDSLTNAVRDPKHKPHHTAKRICDDDINENVWYTFKKSPSMMLYDNCTSIENCGTYFPIWVNGNHPTESNPGPVELPVCVANETSCCSSRWNWTVQVKWCRTKESYMYVYKLKSVPICDMAYCAYQGRGAHKRAEALRKQTRAPKIRSTKRPKPSPDKTRKPQRSTVAPGLVRSTPARPKRTTPVPVSRPVPVRGKQGENSKNEKNSVLSPSESITHSPYPWPYDRNWKTAPPRNSRRRTPTPGYNSADQSESRYNNIEN